MDPKLLLAGKWKYLLDDEGIGGEKGFQSPDLDDSCWKEMEIPGHWYLAGLDFPGKVWFRKRFSLEAAEGARLSFQGVDYMARVWLNGKYLGGHTGYFDPFSFEITPYLEPGRENLLAVEVDGCPDPGFPFRKKFFRGGLGHWDMRPGGWTERGQEKPGSGIWQPVLIETSGPVCILEILPWVMKERDQWRVLVKAKILNRSQEPIEAEFLFSIAPNNFEGGRAYAFNEKRSLWPGVNDLAFEFRVDSPHLWWTWDLGEPRFYKFSLKLRAEDKSSDDAERNIGFREVAWKDDGIYLNGKRVFLRGSCYLSSLWLGEMTIEKSLADLDLVKGAGMNSLRICYHIEPLHFYNQCDHAGILLWQDFPMLWDYDTSPESRAEALSQIRKMVRLLGNHPSIYMWVCHCEPMSVSNRKMDRALSAAVSEEDPTGRRVKASTFMREHPFYGWYLGTKLGFAGIPGSPIPNEFGAQSLPRRKARLWKELGEAAWPPNRQWEYHNFQTGLFFFMRDCASLDDMIEKSQAYQGEVLDFGIQAFRRAKGRIWGIYIFTLVDAWPSITWSIVDYERNVKASYQSVKKAYKRLKLSLDLIQKDATPSPALGWLAWNSHFDLGKKFKAAVWIINDLPDDLQDANLIWELAGPEGLLASDEMHLTIIRDSSEKAARISIPLNQSTPAGKYLLRAKLLHQEKQIDLEEIELYFGPAGTRRRNALRQLRETARADLFHAYFALKTFPVHFLNSLIGKYRLKNKY